MVRTIAKHVLLLTMVAVLQASTLAQQPDRAAPPKPGPAPALKLPPIEKFALANGLRVWLIEQHEVPLLQVNLVLAAGSTADPEGKFGAAAFTAAMLDEGAGERGALELAEATEFLGAQLSTGSSWDASVVRFSVPARRAAEALAIMSDVALRPAFPDAELERLRKERLAAFVQARDDPASIISLAFPRIVYGPTQRYGTSSNGTEGSLRGMTRADLLGFYQANYRPDAATLIVVGDTTRAAVAPLLETAFGGWTAKPAASLADRKGPPHVQGQKRGGQVRGPEAGKQVRGADLAGAPNAAAALGWLYGPPEDAPQLTRREIVLVDKPEAAQSQIRIGWVGVPRSTPDYVTLQVLNTVLGGSFTSRLNTNLRETHGYSYGAYSSFDMRRGAGPFSAAAGVQTDKTAEALREFFNELGGIGKTVPADELEKAKNYVALGFPADFETSGDLARKLEELIVYGLPEDTFTTFVDRVRQVDAAAVAKAAARYIQPDKFAIVIVGDAKTVAPALKALNLGPLKVLSVEDAVGMQ